VNNIYSNPILTHIYEVLPFYLLFEIINNITNKKGYYDFNQKYFLLHFIVNLINTIILIPLIFIMFTDPLLKTQELKEWNSLSYIYPMLIGLHTFHLMHHLKEIKYDEIIHHIITHIFWYGNNYCNNSPLYFIPMIGMSGIPGGITYLMLFLQKFRRVSKLKEKYISMNLNIWLRAPICIIGSTLMYVKNIEESAFGKDNFNYYMTLFMIFFTFINGVHFMNNIIDSYYLTLYKKT
jgi:hypothetical protein